jgi:hypothetical protein
MNRIFPEASRRCGDIARVSAHIQRDESPWINRSNGKSLKEIKDELDI